MAKRRRRTSRKRARTRRPVQRVNLKPLKRLARETLRKLERLRKGGQLADPKLKAHLRRDIQAVKALERQLWCMGLFIG